MDIHREPQIVEEALDKTAESLGGEKVAEGEEVELGETKEGEEEPLLYEYVSAEEMFEAEATTWGALVMLDRRYHELAHPALDIEGNEIVHRAK